MKVTQEVRDFAAKQSEGANSGFPGESRSPEASVDTFLAAEDAEQGMAQMSEKFRGSGGQWYVPEYPAING
jgi:phosphomethylpyrimidine synthase